MSGLRRADKAAELMAAIVESSDSAILGADRDGGYHWNPGAVRLPATSATRSWASSCGRCARRLQDQNVRFSRVAAGQRVERIETQRVRRTAAAGRRGHRTPRRDRAGEVVGASAVVHDITARKRDEAELRRSNPELDASPTSRPTTCASRS